MTAAPTGRGPVSVAAVDRPNVLITSASRKVLLVRSFKDAIRRLGSGRVIGADISPLAAALYEADDARIIPRSDDPAFVEALLRLCEAEGIGLVVPTRDEELPVLARERERFAAAGTVVLVSAPDAVETCRDKARFVAAVAHGWAGHARRLPGRGCHALPGVRQATPG